MVSKSFSIRQILKLIASLAVFCMLSVLVFQRHQNNGYFNWRSEMWGDAVGYYVYLPATFIYDFDSSKFPEQITEKTGEGFLINENGKIVTRYTCGVAILQAPVFFVVHIIAGINGHAQDGFSGIYHYVSSIAADLYAFLGLLLLWIFLRGYFNKQVTILCLLTIFLGTNLMYYTIEATGMSHVYSFFLFSLLLLLSKHYFDETKSSKKTRYFALVALVSSLIVLVRPTNLAFVALAFILDSTSWKDIQTRFIQIFKPVNIIILLLAGFIVFLPQMMYWKYSSGSFFVDSYEGYGFSNWASPNIIKFLFSTNNGLFTYNPIYFVILFALFFMIIKKQLNGYFILILFLGLIYLFSSWFIFSFGCGFGSRNFVEYTTVFALALGFLYAEFFKRNIFKWLIGIPLIVSLVFVNIQLTSAYNKCFVDGDWDWEEYEYLLKLKKYNQTFKFKPKVVLGSKKEFSEPLRIRTDKISDVNFRRAIIEVEAQFFEKVPAANIVFEIRESDSLLYWNGVEIANQISASELGAKTKVKGDFWLPRHYSIDSEMTTYIWNIGKDSLNISRIKFHLE